MRQHFISRAAVLAAGLLLAAACGDDGTQDRDAREDDAATGEPEVSAEDGGGGDAAEEDGEPEAADATEEEPGVTACGLPPRSFWAWDLTRMPPGDIRVPSTCRGWGPHVAVYVADDQWGARMDEEDVRAIVAAFEEATPADPERGIWETVTGLMGEPPDVDGDPRIILLYYDLGEYGMSSFDGYFRAQDEGSCAHCNHAEMLFLDAARNDPSDAYMLSIIPHEMTHMILYAEDPDEEAWIAETLAETSMIACGWHTDTAAVERFTLHPDTPLVEMEHPDYGAAFLFGFYLLERYGAAAITGLAGEPANGIPGFDAVFADDFADVLPRWFVANLVDDPAVAGGVYGYAGFDVPNLATVYGETDGTPRGGSVDGSAADYLYLPAVGPGTLHVTIASADWEKLGAAAASSPEPEEAGNVTVTPLPLTGATTAADIVVPSGHERAVVAIFSARPPAASPFAYTWSASFE